MTRNRKAQLDFDKRGGVLAISRAMLESCAYETMSANAKVLMMLLHSHWRNNKLVAYGVREAAAKIGCKPHTAGKAFKMLEERGFIVCTEQSLFNNRTGSKAREWRLTWMPFLDRNPTHDWEKWRPEN